MRVYIIRLTSHFLHGMIINTSHFQNSQIHYLTTSLIVRRPPHPSVLRLAKLLSRVQDCAPNHDFDS